MHIQLAAFVTKAHVLACVYVRLHACTIEAVVDDQDHFWQYCYELYSL